MVCSKIQDSSKVYLLNIYVRYYGKHHQKWEKMREFLRGSLLQLLSKAKAKENLEITPVLPYTVREEVGAQDNLNSTNKELFKLVQARLL